MLRSSVQRPLVPETPGVYQFKSGGGRLLYIGKAKNIKKRLQQYFSPSSLWKQDMVAKADHVERFPTKSENEAILLETQMIAHHAPPYNNLIKGTSAYVYIKIENHPFPRISTVRQKKKDKALYIGPKVMHHQLKEFLRMARYIFQRRSCTIAAFKNGIACSDYYFGQCGGRCVMMHGDTTTLSKKESLPQSLDAATEQSNNMVRVLRALFTGRITEFQSFIHTKIEDAIAKEHFERAAKLRDMHTYSNTLKAKQTIIIDRMISGLYCTIQSQKNYHIWVVITINEGRIIDIVGHHEHKDDIELIQLLQQIEREYDVTLQKDTEQLDAWYNFSQKSISKKMLQQLYENAKRFIEGYTFSRFASQDPASRDELLDSLTSKYDLTQKPIRIECLDISHFGGENIVGGLSASYHGVLAKSQYKRYKLKTIINNDDYGSIREILLRRFSQQSTRSTFPNLFIIDGGVGQLGVVKTLRETNKPFTTVTQKVEFVSIGKGLARSRKEKQSGAVEVLYRLDSKNVIHEYPIIYDDADRLILLLRDEAHRFANTYRKTLESKRFTGK